MTVWNKIGCLLTGWDKTLLSQSTQASKSKLNKYTSAMLILMIIWGAIGYCFAQRYIGLPIWGCILGSLVCIIVVVMIERQILLTIGRSKWMLYFRLGIALTMAIIGATMLDQTMFGKDIEKTMMDNIEQQVAQLATQRVGTIDSKLISLHQQIDSINNLNSQLQEDVNKKPLIEIVDVEIETVPVVVNGKTIMKKVPKVTKHQVPNPKIDQLNANKTTVDQLLTQEQTWLEKKQNMENEVRAECKASVGFLEELEAMVEIITTRPVAAVFYFIIFLFFMFMEIFIVANKVKDEECDYEIAIRETERIRIEKIRTIMEGLNLKARA